MTVIYDSQLGDVVALAGLHPHCHFAGTGLVRVVDQLVDGETVAPVADVAHATDEGSSNNNAVVKLGVGDRLSVLALSLELRLDEVFVAGSTHDCVTLL